MLVAELGESANELVQKFGNNHGYRYGFPDQYAYGPPVRPMNWDASRIYQGVIGRRYPDAQTMRYHSMYDPNMYMQPGVPAGFGDAKPLFTVQMSPKTAIAVIQEVLALAPSGYYGDYDVVIDGETASGAGVDVTNLLWIIHGGTFDRLRQAIAAAGGNTVLQQPNADLAARIANARQITPSIAAGTLGKAAKIRETLEYMIELLQSGQAKPVAVTPIAVATKPTQHATPKQFAIAGATVGLAAAFAIGAVLLAR